MPIKAVVESLEDVPEALHEHYREDGDVFRLDAEGVEYEDDVRGLKTALEKEKKRRREYREQLQKFEDIDPERYQKLIEAEDERERKQAEKKGEWEKLRTQLQEKHQEQIEAKESSIDGLKGELDTLLVENVAVQEINNLEGSARLLMPHVRDRTKVVEDEDTGEHRVIVVDEKGNRRINDAGEDMTIGDLVAEMRETDDFAGAFTGTGASGGGAPGSGGGGAGGDAIASKADLETSKEKAAYIGEHGREEYLSLPDE